MLAQRTLAPLALADLRCVSLAMVASLTRSSASARRQLRHRARLAHQAAAASCSQWKPHNPWFPSWRLCLL